MITTQAIYNPESQIVLYDDFTIQITFLLLKMSVQKLCIFVFKVFSRGKQFYSIETKWPHENFMTVF
jgi:hypothetical protein